MDGADPWVLRATSAPMALDTEEVKRALRVLVDPQGWVELRGLPSGRQRHFRGGDLDAGVVAAKSLADDKSIYYCLNPLIENKSAKATNIAQRRWILVDADPVRANPDESSTAEEKEYARIVVESVMEHLLERGWPQPVIIDSGNGWHLLYRYDLPNDKHAQSLVKTFLYALAEKFNTARVIIDRGVHDAPRISKLPGAWARKGTSTKDRPHRPCRLIHVPDVVEIVSEDQIRREGSVEPKTEEQPKVTRPDPWMIRASESDKRAYAQAALRNEIARIRLAVPGTAEGRNVTSNRAAFSMGTLVAAGLILEQEALEGLRTAMIMSGLPEREVTATLRSGMEAGKQHPRRVPERNGKAEQKKTADTGDGLIIIRANAISPRKVEWVWPGRIPLGKLTTFAGVGGLGKTFVLCDITARISRGDAWPDSAGECTDPGQVLFISGEDELDDTIVPRLIEMKADLSKVVFLKTEFQDQFRLSDLPMLNKALEQSGPGLRMVVIDPPTAYLGGVDDHKNAELRMLLSPLKSWSGKHRVAMVFNTHVNKPQGAKVEAMMRVMGSVAWVNAVRAAHMFAVDPEDRERRLFIGMKLNIGKEKKGLAYKITPVADLARVDWLGEVDMTADQAINREGPKKRRVVASEWLEDVFGEELEIPSKVIFRRKKEETTLSDDALREAKEDMGIRATQKCDSDGHNQWVWYWTIEARSTWLLKKPRPAEQKGEADECPI